MAILKAGNEPDNIDHAVHAARALDPASMLAQMGDPALRDENVGAAASQVAANPEVREVLLRFQREFATAPPGGKMGAVLDGRDIGTVVCPDADIKFFLEARPETRAARRVKELRERGAKAIHSRVLRDMKSRDQRDKTREVAPLVPARDALVLDTDELDTDAVFAAALEFMDERAGDTG